MSSSETLVSRLTAIAAYVAVLLCYAGTLSVVHAARFVRRVLGLTKRPRTRGELEVLITGTFYNENWFRSHILPLSQTDSIRRIYVVTDAPLFDVQKVVYRCPPLWASRLFGRALTRAAYVMAVAYRDRPDVLMGYHIMPNAVLCLVAASIFGGRAAYQMTGGPIQIIGGGCYSENALLCRVSKPSPLLQRLLFCIVRLFDLLVVRGPKAAGFVAQRGLGDRVAVICGSVDVDRFCPKEVPKKYDVVLVARHIKQKQPHLFLEVVAELARLRPSCQAALAGDGPLTAGLRSRSSELGIEDHLTFLGKIAAVEDLLAVSRLFVLTSKTEGLAIAMVEAMAAGCPVAAPNVGELSELLVDQVNGIFVDPADVTVTARRIDRLLRDRGRLAQMSRQARSRVVEVASAAAIARRWEGCFANLFGDQDGRGAPAVRAGKGDGSCRRLRSLEISLADSDRIVG